MIVEAVMLQVKMGMEEEYESAFRQASKIISSMNGYMALRFYFTKGLTPLEKCRYPCTYAYTLHGKRRGFN